MSRGILTPLINSPSQAKHHKIRHVHPKSPERRHKLPKTYKKRQVRYFTALSSILMKHGLAIVFKFGVSKIKIRPNSLRDEQNEYIELI